MQLVRLQGDAERSLGIYYEFDIHSKPLGVGGMGKVYLGTKVVMNTGARIPVAIKAMYEDLQESVVERARREASIRLKHENLVEMMGFVETFDQNATGGCMKHYHVISEYIHGVMLSDMLCGMTKDQYGDDFEAAQRLYADYTNDRVKTSVKIVKQVLSGVMALHDKGYIHRDIDPSNIMITTSGVIKLIDFGIAKKLETLGTQDKCLTNSGVFIGKPEYAAPELVLGDVQHQNATTDIYSVGILFYQLLTGKLPFTGPKHNVLDAQLHKNLPKKDIHNSDCKQIIAKATRKSQSMRYQSAAEFRVDVDNIKISGGHVNPIIKAIIAGAAIAACIIALVVIKPLDKFVHHEDPVETKIDTNVVVIDPEVDTIKSEKTPIDNSIALALNIDPCDYESVIAIAKNYYLGKSLGEKDKEIGWNIINTQIGKALLSSAKVDTKYSSVKVAFVLYSVTIKAAQECNNEEIVTVCNAKLKDIKKYSGISIQ